MEMDVRMRDSQVMMSLFQRIFLDLLRHRYHDFDKDLMAYSLSSETIAWMQSGVVKDHEDIRMSTKSGRARLLKCKGCISSSLGQYLNISGSVSFARI